MTAVFAFKKDLLTILKSRPLFRGAGFSKVVLFSDIHKKICIFDADFCF